MAQGDTSGYIQTVVDLRVDCDGDAAALVDQTGVACHTGQHNCFFRAIRGGARTITPVMIDMEDREGQGLTQRFGAARVPLRRSRPSAGACTTSGPVRRAPATLSPRAPAGALDPDQRQDNMMAPEAPALMGITNEGRDIPVRQLAQEEGNDRFVVSLTNIRRSA